MIPLEGERGAIDGDGRQAADQEVPAGDRRTEEAAYRPRGYQDVRRTPLPIPRFPFERVFLETRLVLLKKPS